MKWAAGTIVKVPFICSGPWLNATSIPQTDRDRSTALGNENSVPSSRRSFRHVAQRQRCPGAAQQREQLALETDSQAGDQRVPGGAAERLAEVVAVENWVGSTPSLHCSLRLTSGSPPAAGRRTARTA